MGCTVTTIQRDVNVTARNGEKAEKSNTHPGMEGEASTSEQQSKSKSGEQSCSSMSSFSSFSRSSRSRKSRRRRRSSSWSIIEKLGEKANTPEGQTSTTTNAVNNEIRIDVAGLQFEYDDQNTDLSTIRSPRVIRVAGTDHVAVNVVSGEDDDNEEKAFCGESPEDVEEEIKCRTHQCGERVDSGFDWIPSECWIDPNEFGHLFQLEDSLGSGSTCSVSRATKRRCGPTRKCAQSEHAVKQVVRPKKTSSVRREVNILMRCTHPNIVRLDGVSTGPNCFYIVTELCTGGTVIDYMKGRDGVGELEARRIAAQLLDAIQYLHANGIVHRDIKPDNIVFADSSRSRVVLIDFGSARELCAMKKVVKDWAGTPAYMAPEMVVARTREDCKAVDMWAFGVTVYVMLTGYLPFFGPNVKALMTEVRRKRLVYPRGVQISRESTRFVGSLLRKRISHRMTVDEARQHPWITGRFEYPRVLPPSTPSSSSLDSE